MLDQDSDIKVPAWKQLVWDRVGFLVPSVEQGCEIKLIIDQYRVKVSVSQRRTPPQRFRQRITPGIYSSQVNLENEVAYTAFIFPSYKEIEKILECLLFLLQLSLVVLCKYQCLTGVRLKRNLQNQQNKERMELTRFKVLVPCFFIYLTTPLKVSDTVTSLLMPQFQQVLCR